MTGQRLGLPLLRHSVLVLPMLGVVLCSVFLQGLPLYPTGLLVLRRSAYLLPRLFLLWEPEETKLLPRMILSWGCAAESAPASTEPRV